MISYKIQVIYNKIPKKGNNDKKGGEKMGFEIVKFILYSLLIVLIAKYVLVKLLRKLAEGLNLSPKAVGNIAGIATSVPELLTVSFSAFAGLLGTSIYNILSSNIINTVQYLFSIFLNKNQKVMKNRAIQTDLVMVALTIAIPGGMLLFHIDFTMLLVPFFALLFFLFYYINGNAHKLYLKKEDAQIDQEIKEESKWVKGKTNLVVRYSLYLLVTSVALYIIGNQLSNVLENLAQVFSIPEFALGIALGFITSLPELITFFESQKHYRQEEKQELGVVEATNNLLTSNILNLFVIQSIGIIIYYAIGHQAVQEEMLLAMKQIQVKIQTLKK